MTADQHACAPATSPQHASATQGEGAARDEVGELYADLWEGDWKAILAPGAADLLALSLLAYPNRADCLPVTSRFASAQVAPMPTARLYAWQLAFDGDRWLDCVRIDVEHLREHAATPEHHQVLAILERWAP